MERAEAEHLVLFDRDKDKGWEERTFQREADAGGVRDTVWGT